MLDSKYVSKALSRGYLNMGRQASNAQLERFLDLLKAGEELLAADGITLEHEAQVGCEFEIRSPVGTVWAERKSFLNGDAIGAAIVFFCDSSTGRSANTVFLGSVRLYDNKNWVFSKDIEITDHYGQNTTASVIQVIQLALGRKLQHDHEIVMQ
ncbi:hypothetical protein [Comamonas sp. MYb69]|uniref:hypothetical protein n=1 Tax=Comamonas sp. MYb69 TaxID=1848650 RepID=UPI0030A36393